jgi:uncharacterized protein (TIGR03083 family)
MTQPYRLTRDRYLDHLARDSDRFADLLAEADPARPVPSCPDWTAVDLFWHLTEVQWFWGTIVRERLADPAAAEERKPARPTDLDALGHLFTTTSEALRDALANTPDETPVWTWADDQTAGFVLRRQAHEALIHRVDAELVAADPTPLDAELATDGVDEVVRVMYGGIPTWMTFTATAGPVAVRATDSGGAWDLAVGTISGTDPDSGDTYKDEPAVDVVEAKVPVAEVSADAGTLDAWFWGRSGADAVTRSGDPSAVDALAAVVGTGIQ